MTTGSSSLLKMLCYMKEQYIFIVKQYLKIMKDLATGVHRTYTHTENMWDNTAKLDPNRIDIPVYEIYLHRLSISLCKTSI